MKLKTILRLLLSLFLVVLVGCTSRVDTTSTTELTDVSVETNHTQQNDDEKLGDKTLVIHYKRTNGDYDDWNLWLWQSRPIDKDGKEYSFTRSDDFGKVARIPLKAELNDSTKIGIIVKKGDWEEKDIDQNRFINTYETDENNEVHVWLLQGEEMIYKNLDNMYLGPRVTAYTINSLREITIETDQEISNQDKIELLGGLENLDIRDVNINTDGMGATLTLAGDFDFSHTDYRILINGSTAKSFKGESLYNTNLFDEFLYYDGDDLGVTYTKSQSSFRVWAPIASEMKLTLYNGGDATKNDIYKQIDMTKSLKGTWVATVDEDLHGKYYTYKVTNHGNTHEVVDPYAKSAGVNGRRGMILDLNTTDPLNWNLTTAKTFVEHEDAIIYELHVRDLSIHETSNVKDEYKGKFMAFTQEGTTYTNEDTGVTVTTGLDHIKELGITHVHLLPAFDYASVDERRNDQFNWGYDPLNFNVPEGSYSTDPYNGEVRVNEFKQMVQSMHQNGIRVVMDVVYNHTGPTHDSNLNKLVPNYYYRIVDGHWSNGSGTGSETASERKMVRKFIVDSVVYWATEYKIDGFRFDLMALHDIETMNQVRAALDEIDPSIIVYGEGWTGGLTPLPWEQQVQKHHISQVPGVGVFNDDIREGLKSGFIQTGDRINDVKFGIVGAIDYYDPNNSNDQTYSDKYTWASDPQQSINYVTSHDNETLWDQIYNTAGHELESTRIQMQKLANSVVLTSQGIPFLHAGVDFLRTKDGEHNSYNLPDEINQLEWDRKAEYNYVFEYYKGLIKLRNEHPAFRLNTREEVIEHFNFIHIETYSDSGEFEIIGYTLNNHANGDDWETILVLFNGNDTERTVDLAEYLDGTWNVVVDENTAGTEILDTVDADSITVAGHGTIIAYK
ncbi:type I pullulanase [Haloplasma contractile]|uniref:pullulanase n=1 Tax=Haloplasma contractile SSD-17B TaxID=1033810 RepID=U2DXT8_9MOLU|nr:type I pullulanase [Haloplasma contractile]ERJ13072.1 pyrophosphate--fructose-6-phosphate 1-phosphotransferase protein [Haloplasma contractile SSD-17B]